MFTIPWEYSLDLGAPFGNIARMAGTGFAAGSGACGFAGRTHAQARSAAVADARALSVVLLLVLLDIEPEMTLEKLRGYFQEMMIVWLVWEFVRELPAICAT